MSDFLIIYSVFSYLFITGVLLFLSCDLDPKHIPGAIFMFILAPIVLPVLTGFALVLIGDK